VVVIVGWTEGDAVTVMVAELKLELEGGESKTDPILIVELVELVTVTVAGLADELDGESTTDPILRVVVGEEDATGEEETTTEVEVEIETTGEVDTTTEESVDDAEDDGTTVVVTV